MMGRKHRTGQWEICSEEKGFDYRKKNEENLGIKTITEK